ncbi:NlpC/P60 family protein [Nocardioides sp. CFH 31398]|uniref:C40 family peptidase n=1 Tax=Nocardioides sp. CFH 31398 TaxID=2919579 RepID=UPI001F054831|nr:NlpC/P60 family protein [Nocardioides sp. CFH 31398]MCH1868216.1 NlpC/P60 family protein [Nocardioides sp. CFH 31398]
MSTSLVILSFAVGPANADPDVDDIDKVADRVDRLWHDAEQAQERHHDASIELKELRRELRGLRSDAERQSTEVDGVRTQVEDSIVSQYTAGAGVGTVGELAVSEDPDRFLSDLSTMSSFNDMQDDMFDDFATEADALRLREQAVADRTSEVEQTEAELREEMETVEQNADEAQEILDGLEEEQREQIAAASSSGSTTEVPSDVPPAGRAQAAVDYALAQVGDSYVYGASGPDAFDCSGLTSMAWAQAGVALPRSSSAQMAGGGTPVSMSELQPGDLVFYYSPVSHVALYIGNGQIVHAANPGTGVVVAGVSTMPVSGAVRPG